MEYQTSALIVAIMGVIVAIVKIWLTSKEKLASHKEFVISELASINQRIIDNTKEIEEHRVNTNLQIEEVKKEKAERLRDLWKEIDMIKKAREDDLKELTKTFERSIEKYTTVEERHHTEVMSEIRKLMVELSATRATFDEYRKRDDRNQRNMGRI